MRHDVSSVLLCGSVRAGCALIWRCSSLRRALYLQYPHDKVRAEPVLSSMVGAAVAQIAPEG
jgi:hypothetical protein